MNLRLSRRTIIAGAAASALIPGVPAAVHASSVRQDVQSGGIGLTMDDIEAIYGPGEPGQSYMVFRDPMYGVDLHIGHEDQIVDYVWLVLGDERSFEGTLLEDAWYLVSSLLPTDARLRETYAMPETPGSMGFTEMIRLTSRWLDDVLDDRSSILASVTSYPLEEGQVAMRGWIMVEQRS